jgi:DNA-binding XRE family transcriptional regulator
MHGQVRVAHVRPAERHMCRSNNAYRGGAIRSNNAHRGGAMYAAGCHERAPMPARSPQHAALGLAIRELRRASGISQEALAANCGLHRTYVGGIERGERNVSFANLLRIADALAVRPSELLERSERHLREA